MAAEALAPTGVAGEEALPALAKLLEDEEEGVREAARDATRKIRQVIGQEYAGVNLAAAERGASVRVSSMVHEEFGAHRLNNGITDGDDVWTSASRANYPQEIMIALPEGKAYSVSRVIVIGTEWVDLYGNRMPREVEIRVSAKTDAPEDFEKVTTAEIDKVAEPQPIDFDPVTAKYVALVILSNHGNEKYVELSEVEVWGEPEPVE